MKKIATTLLCLFITANFVHADIFSIGPRVGAGIFQIKVHPTQDDTDVASLQLENNWGYHVGFFTRFDLVAFHIQPEVLFTGASVQAKQRNGVFKLGFTKLDIPAMLGLSLLEVFRVQIGPVFSWLLSATEGNKDVKEHYSNMTTGWQAGLGVDIWKVCIDLKYEGSLSRFGDEIAGINTNHGHTMWMLSIGVNML